MNDSVMPSVTPSVGLNKFDLFLQYLGCSSHRSEDRKASRILARKAISRARESGVPYLRYSASGFHPVAYNSPGDLDLWKSDPGEFWRRYDEMMDDLDENGMRIIPVLMWNWEQFPAMTGETTARLINDPRSQSSALLLQFIRGFIERYKGRTTPLFYELTNELNLHADLNMEARSETDKRLAERSRPVANFSTDQMIPFIHFLAEYVRDLDPHRAVSSGFSLPRPYAEHLRRSPEYSDDGPDFMPDTYGEFEKNLLDLHQGVEIISVHFYNRDGENERFGHVGHNNAGFLKCVKRIADDRGKPLFLGEFGDHDPHSDRHVEGTQHIPFAQDVLDKIVELQIPLSAPWVWEFYNRSPDPWQDLVRSTTELTSGYTDLILSGVRDANEKISHSHRDSNVTSL